MTYARFFTAPRYDYYRGTFDDMAITGKPLPTWQDVITTLVDVYPLGIPQVDARPFNPRAEKAFSFSHEGEVIFRFCWGGETFGDRIHFEAKGQNAVPMADYLRTYYPNQYSCSRVDVCFDTVQEGMFRFLSNLMSEFAIEKKIQPKTNGDWLTNDFLGKGRSLYLGMPEKTRDTGFTRLYEKGKKGKTNYESWVRFEVEMNAAKKADKRKLAQLNPMQVAFAKPWIAELMLAIGFTKPDDFIKIATVWKRPDSINSLIHAAIQYKKVWRDLSESLNGGEGDIGALLLALANMHDDIGNIKSGISIGSDKQGQGMLGLTKDPYIELIKAFKSAA